MSVRYVVAVTSDTAVRIYGGYSSHERAEEFAAKVRDGISKQETREWDGYNRRHDPEEMAPHIPAWASVRVVHEPRSREAIRFAVTGSPDPLDAGP